MKIFQQSTQKSIEETLEAIGFMLGDEEFAIPILNIKEIVKPTEYTRIPLAPCYILGVFNLRGNIIPLIDLRQKFGMPKRNFSDKMRILVIHHQTLIIGLMIEKLTGVLHLNKSEIEHHLTQKEKSHIYGIGKQGNKLVTILQVEELFSTPSP